MADRAQESATGDRSAEHVAGLEELHDVANAGPDGANRSDVEDVAEERPPPRQASSRESSTHHSDGNTHLPSNDFASGVTNPSHRAAALRCLNGLISRTLATDSNTRIPSTASTQPVLVRTYDSKMKTSKPRLDRPNNSSGLSSANLPSDDMKQGNFPPLSAFSFHEILAAIDPDIRNSIDTIAEICGRSKMSLANEYDAHMPPHGVPRGELNFPRIEESTEAVQSILHRYLEPVEETASSQGQSSSAAAHASTGDSSYGNGSPTLSDSGVRGTSWALLGAGQGLATSTAVTQSHNITSHPYSVGSPTQEHHPEPKATPDVLAAGATVQSTCGASQAKTFQNLITWLRQFSNSGQAIPPRNNQGQEGKSATETLKDVLGS